MPHSNPSTTEEKLREPWEDRFDEQIFPFCKPEDCSLYTVPNISTKNKCWIIENKLGEVKEFIRYLLSLQATQEREGIERIINEHNGRILNEFQLQGTADMPIIAYDERVCLKPAMKIATEETLSTLKEKK